MKDLPSGSYELQLLGKPKLQIIKKHGSNIFLCRKEINPYQALEKSDNFFLTLTRKQSRHHTNMLVLKITCRQHHG